MSNIFEKLTSAANNTTTYRIGLLQAKAYRSLKQQTTEALAHLDISTTDWAFLGLLYDHKDGMRATDVAEELGVEAPFVSVLLKKFETREFLFIETSPDDSRSKVVSLTEVGRAFVPSTEKNLRLHMRQLVSGASIQDIVAYISVLETIIQNASKLKK